jgi:hypothetical protein
MTLPTAWGGGVLCDMQPRPDHCEEMPSTVLNLTAPEPDAQFQLADAQEWYADAILGDAQSLLLIALCEGQARFFQVESDNAFREIVPDECSGSSLWPADGTTVTLEVAGVAVTCWRDATVLYCCFIDEQQRDWRGFSGRKVGTGHEDVAAWSERLRISRGDV